MTRPSGDVPVPSEPAQRRVSDVACTVCGCVCDDLTIEVQGDRVVRAERACVLAEPWLMSQRGGESASPLVRGRPVAFDEAVREAAAILGAARAPLVYGLSRSSTPGQRAACALADRLGASIDTTASSCHAQSVMAVQQVGEQTCTLGEVRHRADLVIFWGTNPLLSHPRHFERYSVDPRGDLIPRGRADRFVVVVDVRPTESTARADLFLQVKPGSDFEVLWTLRGLVRGVLQRSDLPRDEFHEQLASLAERMRQARFGIVFFGLGLSLTGAGSHNVEALLRLVRELNDHTRFYARRMRVQGDVTGADLVLAWQTGYPFSVNLARGYPRYNPGEYSAQGLLERAEVDACLLVGSEGVARFSSKAKAELERLPVIALDYPRVPAQLTPTIQFTTGVYGVHRAGTAYRMDEVPVPLRGWLTSNLPSDEDVLNAIAAQLPDEAARESGQSAVRSGQ